MSIICTPFQNPSRQDVERLDQEDEVQASSLNVIQNVACGRLLQSQCITKFSL